MRNVDKRTSIVLIFSENYACHIEAKISHSLKGNHEVLECVIKRNERKVCSLFARNKGVVNNYNKCNERGT